MCHASSPACRVAFVPLPGTGVAHAEESQGSCHVFRALDPVARRRPAVRKRGMSYRPPGADQLVPYLSRAVFEENGPSG